MDIYEARARYLEKLRTKGGVVSVGVGYKTIGGQPTRILSIIVGVREKKPLDQLRKRDIVPRLLGGFSTDVEELGEIKFSSYTERLRPAVPGISIGHFQITAGTFGCLVVDSQGLKLMLSNNHVLGNINRAEVGDPILQPGAHDGGTVDNDTIAHLLRFVPIKMGGPSLCFLTRFVVAAFNILARILSRSSRIYSYYAALNKVDCALATPLQQGDISGSILGIGLPTGVAHAELGDSVRKVGRTTELTEGRVSQVDVTVMVNMGDGAIAMFDDQIAIGGEFSAPGDSGSLILKDLKAVGLLFAGSDKITMANRIQNVLQALGVTIPYTIP